jgi:hypothetical protein
MRLLAVVQSLSREDKRISGTFQNRAKVVASIPS